MKIGIITLLGNNYGNRLQNYAVQELLRNIDNSTVYTVTFEKNKINKGNANISKKNMSYYIKAFNSRMKNIYSFNYEKHNFVYNGFYFLFCNKKMNSLLQERNEKFKKFDQCYINYEDKTLTLDNNTWVKDYDFFVCGSDQIWNPYYPTCNELAFLQFIEEKKRISLSASFGVNEIPNNQEENYKKWLTEIPNISVREKEGVDIVKKLTDKDATLLLDPTMLVDISVWEEMMKKPENHPNEKYAVCYFLGNLTKDYKNFINKMSKKYNLKIISVLDIEDDMYFSCDPAELVYLISHAEHIFTDSFHGSVFSILFKRNFTVFDRVEEGKSMSSRIKTLLQTFHIEEKMYMNGEDISNKKVNYDYIEEVLKDNKDRYKKFIDSALER